MTTENTELTEELAAPENIESYVEQRHEEIAEDSPPIDGEDELLKEVRDHHPAAKEAKKASRYERLKRARDQYKQEAESLRARLGQAPEPSDSRSEPLHSPGEPQAVESALKRESSLESAMHLHGPAFENAYNAFIEYCKSTRDAAAYQRVMQSGDPGAELVAWHNDMGNPVAAEGSLDEAMQEGRDDVEVQQFLAQRDAQIRLDTEAALRCEQFAQQAPDFYQTIQEADACGIQIPQLMLDLMKRSPLGPEIGYIMARDFFGMDGESHGLAEQAQALANDPIAQARMVGAIEQQIFYRRNQAGASAQQQQRATKAPPPLQPVRGGGTPPKDLHSLSKSDDASEYISARRGRG